MIFRSWISRFDSKCKDKIDIFKRMQVSAISYQNESQGNNVII